jgi:hypothetical protein
MNPIIRYTTDRRRRLSDQCEVAIVYKGHEYRACSRMGIREAKEVTRSLVGSPFIISEDWSHIAGEQFQPETEELDG